MTAIENEARRRLNAGHGREVFGYNDTRRTSGSVEAMCRLIEQHEAFRQEVSDAVEGFYRDNPYEISCYCDDLKRFIIPKTDPLVEALNDLKDGRAGTTTESYAACLRAAIEARGGRIVWEGE